jgi:hypothetical protein
MHGPLQLIPVSKAFKTLQIITIVGIILMVIGITVATYIAAHNNDNQQQELPLR